VLQEATVERDGTPIGVEHLAGLTPLMCVRVVSEGGNADRSGIKAGDIFARIGDAQWPSGDEGLRQIRSPGRQSVHITVLREGKTVDIGEVPVTDKRIGIEQSTTADASNVVTRFPRGKVSVAGKARVTPFAAETADIPPGSRIIRVGVRETPTLREVRAAIQELISAGQSAIPLTVALPGPASPPNAEPKATAYTLHLDEVESKAIAALGWESPIPLAYFDPVEVVIKRASPLAAIGKGMQETHKMVLTTYLTFARLFQGSVKVEHLKGPIGIADVGTRLAGKGMIWLLFFMAAVSVNLAVVNFLPLPIVDGGHFCFLLWEQFTGRPVSPAVQNVAALIGLALIGAVFLMTTYNDLANLIWR
jgi:regulator of sigma E protease